MNARQRPLLLGHRGARAVKTIPENTITSFDRCLADGCDGFEFDVRLTADGRGVVCHDPQFNGVEIARASTAELAGLSCLEDVLERYSERAFLDIELKVGGLENRVAALLKEHPAKRGFVVSSFLPEVLQAVRKEAGSTPLGLICETQAELARWNELAIEYVIPHRKLVDQVRIGVWTGAGKKILVWTVNEVAEMRRLAEWGVDGIISDDAGLLSRTFTS